MKYSGKIIITVEAASESEAEKLIALNTIQLAVGGNCVDAVFDLSEGMEVEFSGGGGNIKPILIK